MADAGDEHRPEDLTRGGLDDELGECPAESGCRSIPFRCRADSARRARTRGIPQQQRVASIELREETTHEARALGLRAEAVMHPLALPDAVDEPRFTQDLQMARHPGLALPQGLSQIRDAQCGVCAQCQETQPAGLTGCAQPLHDIPG